jgi:hypothetical protein
MKNEHEKKQTIKLEGLSFANNEGISLFFLILAFAAIYILFNGDPDGCDAIRKILLETAGLWEDKP